MTAVRRGQLTRLRRGVYASSSACAPAVTAAEHGGSLGCVSAARHLGLWVLDESPNVHVWLGSGGHNHAHPECECVTHWDDRPAVDSFGIMSVPRILRQILACHGIEGFVVALESAIHRHLIGRVGLAWLRSSTNDAAREALDFARGEAESGIETLVRWRLRRRGIRIRAQVQIVAVGRVDFLLGDRLIVEVDGKVNHDGASARHKDLLRDAGAASWDYTTLRFDYAMVVYDWETVEHAILAQVDAGRHLR